MQNKRQRFIPIKTVSPEGKQHILYYLKLDRDDLQIFEIWRARHYPEFPIIPNIETIKVWYLFLAKKYNCFGKLHWEREVTFFNWAKFRIVSKIYKEIKELFVYETILPTLKYKNHYIETLENLCHQTINQYPVFPLEIIQKKYPPSIIQKLKTKKYDYEMAIFAANWRLHYCENTCVKHVCKCCNKSFLACVICGENMFNFTVKPVYLDPVICCTIIKKCKHVIYGINNQCTSCYWNTKPCVYCHCNNCLELKSKPYKYSPSEMARLKMLKVTRLVKTLPTITE